MKPTEAQIRYIKDIEEYLGVEFHGITKQDATKFLNQYVPIYKDKLDIDMAEQEAMVETANIEREISVIL